MQNNQQELIQFWGGGTSQAGRLAKALLPEYAKIDDRSLSDMLAFAASYAKLVKYYNEKNTVSGDWEGFFMTDISVILSVVLSTDLRYIETEYQKLVHKIGLTFQPDSKVYEKGIKYRNLLALFEHIQSIFDQVNTWYYWIIRITPMAGDIEDAVGSELKNAIEQNFRQDLLKLKAFDLGADKSKKLGKPIGLNYDAFGSVWGDLDVDPENIYDGKSLDEQLNAALVELRLLYRAAYNNLGNLIHNAGKYFEHSIGAKSDHHPHVGLFIAFLRIFRHAQEDLNHLSERHLDFYFRKILKQSEKSAIPDQIHVCFEPSKQVKKHQVKKGLEISAGRDEAGNPIVFATEDPLEVNQAQVESFKTLYISQNPDKQIGRYAIVTDIFMAPKANSKNGMGTPFDEPLSEWPLFGEDQEKREFKTMTQAKLGFALASPVLFLQEGRREVTLHMKFDQDSTRNYRRLIEGLVEKLENSDEDMTLKEAFFRVFPAKSDRTFRILASGDEEWIEIEPGEIDLIVPEEWSAEEMILKFSLPASQPAVVPFDSRKLKEDRFVTRHPVVKILINHSLPFGYSFLKYLRIESVDISVSVDKVKRFSIYNDIGRLDANQPFQPFGPQPSVGSYLLVGNTEVFKKELTDLSFRIEWQNLPRPHTIQGFADHYQHYKGLEFDTDSYLVKISALSNNEFSPLEEDEPQTLPLFLPDDPDVDDEGDMMIRRCILNGIQVDRLDIVPNYRLNNVDNYDTTTESGFFKLELANPPHAFGHQDYARIFTEVATDNANNATLGPNGEGNENSYFPNIPYTPLIKEISLSYQAKTTINVKAGGAEDSPDQLFHIYPFGVMNTYRKGSVVSDEANYLLPQFDHDAYLFLGLKNVRAPQTLSLLFQLSANKAKGHSQHQLPNLHWQYLANDEWKSFADTDHLLDTTDSFTKTGIVRIKVPAGISSRNSRLPSGLYWIRIGVKGDASILCNAIDIRSQAVAAKWVDNGNSERLGTPLPANSVTGLVNNQPEIKGVSQPFPSFDGQPAERSGMFYRRVSERLRHKGRAISHWDYERLVLGKFHNIFQVKCLSHLSHPEEITRKGEVWMVVVPAWNTSIEEITPKVNYKTLQNIHDYLSDNVSPFVKLRVRNPSYEYLRIICDVKFTQGNNNGHTLERLQEDLSRFLCPWLYDNQATVSIGGSISEEIILNYIKGLGYVKFVTRFSIVHIFVEDEEVGVYKFLDTAEDPENLSIQAKPWAVLIPDVDHEIKIVEEEVEEPPAPSEEPIRFQNRLDIFKSRKEEGRHITIKLRPPGTIRPTTRSVESRPFKLNIKI